MSDNDPYPSRELISSMNKGDAQAGDELLRRHLPGLRAFVRLRTDPGLRAQEPTADIVQSVCREVLEGKRNYEYQGEGSFRN